MNKSVASLCKVSSVVRRCYSKKATIQTSKEFLLSVGEKFNIHDINGWYSISKNVDQIVDHINRQGHSFMRRSELIMKSLPEYHLLPWKFDKVPQNFWSDLKNQRKYLEWLEKELGYTSKDDWYKVTASQIVHNKGSGLLQAHKSSIIKMLASVFPEHEWLPWKFPRVSKGYWNSIENQRKFMNWLGSQLSYQNKEDFYNDIMKYGGTGLVHYYSDSTSAILQSVFPEHNWVFWKFQTAPKNALKTISLNPEKEKEMLQTIMKALNIRSESDWFNVTHFQLKSVLNSKISVTTLRQIISKHFPNIDFSQFMYIKKSQVTLKNFLHTLFPNCDIVEDFKNPDMVHDSTGFPIELDVYIPQFKLAFEYQGLQHYEDVEIFHTNLLERKKRDEEKKVKCQIAGITLIPIPYWWDHTLESLNATIYKYKPDLFTIPPPGEPIPIEYMHKFNKKSIDKNASNCLMLATNWDPKDDPTGWWMCEKFDGMRVHWDPIKKTLYTRNGKKIEIPKFIAQEMPNMHVDIELWYSQSIINIYTTRTQYGLFQDAVAYINNKSEKKWENAILCVFDVVMPDVPFEERLNHLEELKGKKYVRVVEYTKCTSAEHLEKFMENILKKNGEGVMLREPHSMYIKGRSTSMKKYKKYLDMEVRVVEPKYPYGLDCIQTNGSNIFVRFADSKAPSVQPGAIITIKYSGVNTNGVVQYPTFFRVRNDVTWDYLVNDKSSQIKVS